MRSTRKKIRVKKIQTQKLNIVLWVSILLTSAFAVQAAEPMTDAPPLKEAQKAPQKKLRVYVQMLKARSLKKNIRSLMTVEVCKQLEEQFSVDVMCEPEVVEMLKMVALNSSFGSDSNLSHIENRAKKVSYILIPVAKPEKDGHSLKIKLYKNSPHSSGLNFALGDEQGIFSQKASGKVSSATADAHVVLQKVLAKLSSPRSAQQP